MSKKNQEEMAHQEMVSDYIIKYFVAIQQSEGVKPMNFISYALLTIAALAFRLGIDKKTYLSVCENHFDVLSVAADAVKKAN